MSAFGEKYQDYAGVLDLGLSQSEKDKANLDLIWSVVNILMYLSNTINFLMYILSGSLFRQEIRTVLTGKQR